MAAGRRPLSHNRDRVGDTQEGKEIKIGTPKAISYFLANSYWCSVFEMLISKKANHALTQCREGLLVRQPDCPERQEEEPLSGWVYVSTGREGEH